MREGRNGIDVVTDNFGEQRVSVENTTNAPTNYLLKS